MSQRSTSTAAASARFLPLRSIGPWRVALTQNSTMVDDARASLLATLAAAGMFAVSVTSQNHLLEAEAAARARVSYFHCSYELMH